MPYAYQLVAEKILRRIRDGEWGRGTQIPPLNDLERIFPQSRMTLYKALQELTKRGYLTMTRGRGTFVRETEERRRVAILVSPAMNHQGASPFVFQAFRHAHDWFRDNGIDSQLYAEDPLSNSGLPRGMIEELERDRLAGLLSIDTLFPTRGIFSAEWRRNAVPLVNIGAIPTPHHLYVDSGAFVDRAVKIAAAHGRRRPALLEKQEHLPEHLSRFNRATAALGMTPCLVPQDDMPARNLDYERYGFELIHRYWSCKDRPDALIVPDDVIAKGVAQGALALRLRVPDDVLIIAMTNRDAKFFYPVDVLSIEVDVRALAVSASKMLVALMQGKRVPERSIYMKPRVIQPPPVPAPAPVGRKRRVPREMTP